MEAHEIDHIIKQRDAAFTVVRDMQDRLTKLNYEHVEKQAQMEGTIRELRKRIERMSRSGNTLSRSLWLVDYQAYSAIIHDWEDAKHAKFDA